MITFYRKYWRTAFDIGLIVLTVFLTLWVFSLLYSIATPIFFALVIFYMIEPLARFLHKRGVKKSIASGISILLFLAIIVSALVAAGFVFYKQATSIYIWLSGYEEVVREQVLANSDYLQKHLPEETFQKLQEYTSDIAEQGLAVGTWLLNKLLTSITSASTFFFNLLIGMILAYFLSVESELWKRLAKDKTPRTFKLAFEFLKVNVLKGIGTYLKAQLKLVSLTFVIVLISLLAIGVNNAFSVAVLTAFFDVLPLLGVASLFIPWIGYLFIVGQTSLAVKLLVIMIVVLLVRQILEPKITGDSLGVSAFTTLAFMVVSLSLFGVAGLILSPVLIILIKALYDQGYLKQWIHMPEDEYESKTTQG